MFLSVLALMVATIRCLLEAKSLVEDNKNVATAIRDAVEKEGVSPEESEAIANRHREGFGISYLDIVQVLMFMLDMVEGLPLLPWYLALLALRIGLALVVRWS